MRYPTHLIGADDPERAAAVREAYRQQRARNQRAAVRSRLQRLLSVPPPDLEKSPEDNPAVGGHDDE